MKSILVLLLSLSFLSIGSAAEAHVRTFIVRGEDEITYSGGKEGLRSILISFLKIKSENPIKIHCERNTAVVIKDQKMDFGIKSRNHSYEVVNGFHRFTVLPEDSKDKSYAIIANQSLEVAVTKFIDSLYDR